jgi:hypothetical protein
MKLFLTLSRVYIPAWIKKQYLQQLFDLTASAFQDQAPQIKTLAYQQGLLQFARYSKAQTESSIRLKQDVQLIKSSLYDNAFQLGRSIRKRFKLKTAREIIILSKAIYRVLGTDFNVDLRGEVLIKKCFFSQFYSREVCEIISSIDEGVLAGLSGGGKLSFIQRLTEGKNCCRAYFDLKELRE